MRLSATALAPACLLLCAGPVAFAGDVLFYSGHSGLDEGHSQFASIVAGAGGSIDFDASATLPSLDGYEVVFISLPGFSNPEDLFGPSEVDALNAFLGDPGHRVVLIGEWDGFYWAGIGVLMDLLAQIGGGTGIQFLPGLFDSGCYSYNCDGALGASPLVDGLSHVCRADTAVWDEGTATPVAFPIDSPSDPWIVAHETAGPCLVGLGDSNTLSDGCGHPLDPDTAEFARRLYLLDCEGDPTPVESVTWGSLKRRFR